MGGKDGLGPFLETELVAVQCYAVNALLRGMSGLRLGCRAVALHCVGTLTNGNLCASSRDFNGAVQFVCVTCCVLEVSERCFGCRQLQTVDFGAGQS